LLQPGSCLLCGRSNGPVRMTEGGFVGRACDCGIIYIDPSPDPAAVPATTDAHLDGYYSLPAQLRFDWTQRFVTGGRFLDVGCGPGPLIRQALDRGFEAEAVEPNAACADAVRRRYGIAVEQTVIERSELPAGRFDLIYHVDLLSHFPDPVRALEAMAERLAPGGVMCFEVGLFAGLDPKWYPWVGRPRFPAHRRFFSEAGLETVLGRAGFELVAIKTFAIAPSTILSAALRKVLPNRLEAVPLSSTGSDALPARGNRLQRAYARVHHLLRYRLGAVIPFPGPRTAFVAARRTTEAC
jgi:SAM-dependent methyltransferase